MLTRMALPSEGPQPAGGSLRTGSPCFTDTIAGGPASLPSPLRVAARGTS